MLGSLFKFTEKALATQILKLAKKYAYHGSYSADKREVMLKHASTEESLTINLINLFSKFEAMPSAQRKPAIDAFVSEMIAHSEEPSTQSIIESLALRVRTHFEMHLREKLTILHHDQYNTPVLYGEPPQAMLELIADGESTISVVDTIKLATLKLSVVEAYQRGLQQLESASHTSPWQQVAEHIWQSVYQDDYDFARLVAPVNSLSYPFTGSPIAFAPSHSICLVTDNASASTLSTMVEMGNQMAASHRPMSQTLWHQNRQGNWTPWAAPTDHPAFNVIDLQRNLELSNCYEEQKSCLYEALEAAGKDIFVASFQLFTMDDKAQSACSYTLGVSSYLPKTDTVAIVDMSRGEDNSLVGMLSWAMFETIVGTTQLALLENEMPERYAVLSVDKTTAEKLIEACE